jgi:hypothetical protein
MKQGFLSSVAWAAVLLLPAMALAGETAPKAESASTQVAAATADWKTLVRAAKREGKVEVNLGGQMPRKLRTAMPAFTKKYGIKVNFKTGGSRGHRARMFAERKMGRFEVDVWIGGANGALAAIYPKKLLVSLPELLIDPKVKDQSLWYKGKHHYTDPERRLIFTWGASPSYNVSFNTKLVKADEIKSYQDLLNPKWKGKIVSWVPYRTGTAASAVPMFLNPKIGEKWFRRWATEMKVRHVRPQHPGQVNVGPGLSDPGLPPPPHGGRRGPVGLGGQSLRHQEPAQSQCADAVHQLGAEPGSPNPVHQARPDLGFAPARRRQQDHRPAIPDQPQAQVLRPLLGPGLHHLPEEGHKKAAPDHEGRGLQNQEAQEKEEEKIMC